MNRYLTLAAFIFYSFCLSANKDRIEKPKTYTFIFQGNDTVVLKDTDSVSLRSYSQDILEHKKILLEARLIFKTGEILVFKQTGGRWTNIRLSINKKETDISEKTLHKISEVHFGSVALLWNGHYKSAVAAGAFYVQFDMGMEKSFNQYPGVQLFFSKESFVKAEIWRPVDEKTIQRSAL